jgi:GntR family histidine utilization transcriptional repressor
MTVEERIRSDIEARIHAGAWPPGTRIPIETELAAEYGCARATVSKALGRLAHDGLIERRRKAGSFVAHPQVHSAVLEVPDLQQLIAARGETYRWQRTRAPVTGLDPDLPGSVLLVEGIHFANEEAFALERRAIVLATVPEAEAEAFATEAPGTWLLRHVPWTSARHRIRAVEASAPEARALAIRSGAACLELERETWRAGDPVTRVRQLYRGDRFDLVAEFKP